MWLFSEFLDNSGDKKSHQAVERNLFTSDLQCWWPYPLKSNKNFKSQIISEIYSQYQRGKKKLFVKESPFREYMESNKTFLNFYVEIFFLEIMTKQAAKEKVHHLLLLECFQGFTFLVLFSLSDVDVILLRSQFNSTETDIK